MGDVAPTSTSGLREALQEYLRQGETWHAVQAARQFLEAEPGPRSARVVSAVVKQWPHDDPRLVPVRVALLASFSIEFCKDALVASAFASGMRVDVYQPGFDQYRQEILQADSALYRFAPEALVLALEGKDICPIVYDGFEGIGEGEVPDVVQSVPEDVGQLLRAFRRHSNAALIVHNLGPARHTALGVRDATIPRGQHRLISDINERIARAVREIPAAHVLDYAALVGRVGAERWYDERMRLFAHAPLSSVAVPSLAAEWCRFLRAQRGLAKKCLVVDLDNTLWGGVVGEDGPSGIALGPAYPGSAFIEFQKALRGLQRRGVLLAIASKNNEADAREVLDGHVHMLLRSRDFVAMQIHWEEKSTSLRRIARELNLGLEHMVFVDDNPVECERVRRELPMLTVIALPREPSGYVAALARDGWFDTLAVSAEDGRRDELYRIRAQAEGERDSFASLEDYLRSLGMVLEFAPVGAASLARAAQLTQKTNQYNATTRRYTDAEVAARAGDPEWRVHTVAVQDRFGDHGIVGLVMARQNGDALDVETFLLSCRVIGRKVETAMLAFLCDQAVRTGCRRVTGTIVPTAKNAPVRELYAQHGFSRETPPESVETRWNLDLDMATVAWPDGFTVLKKEH